MNDRLTFKEEGVWVARPGLVHFTADDIAFLEHEAPLTKKRRARICAHQEGDRVHQMLIAFCADSVNPMHAHEKMESISVLKGNLLINFNWDNVVLLAGDFLRIPAHCLHQPVPMTACVILETAEK